MIERKENGYVSIKEYYEFLKKEVNKKQSVLSELEKDIKVLMVCSEIKKGTNNDLVVCNITSIGNLLESKKTPEEFIKILKVLFGDMFFEAEKHEEVIDSLFGKIYGFKHGYLFNMPKTWMDFYVQIRNCCEIFKKTDIKTNEKEPYYLIMYSIKSLIEKTLAEKIEEKRELGFILRMYNNFMAAYDKTKKIAIDEKEVEIIRQTLNKDSRKFIALENNEEKNIGFGDGFLKFVSCYNDALDEIKTIKQASKKDKKPQQEKQNNISLKNKVKKYYTYLSKISIKNINDEKLPSYSDPDFQSIMNELLQLLKDNEKYVSINAILSAYYIAYFKSEDYKKVYTDGQTNEIEPKVVK